MIYVGITFALLSCLVCVTNIVNYTLRMLRKRKGEGFRKGSSIHVLSIAFAVMAYVFAGDTLGAWVFIPAIIDPATLFILAVPILLIRMKRKAGGRQDNTS